mmetsp:Transcript_54457/g.129780  ORF Transcript_54457/g.129780 Transcript_54457/m.129780 type:complete len:191 (+) Transcript_54457:116-688(+)
MAQPQRLTVGGPRVDSPLIIARGCLSSSKGGVGQQLETAGVGSLLASKQRWTPTPAEVVQKELPDWVLPPSRSLSHGSRSTAALLSARRSSLVRRVSEVGGTQLRQSSATTMRRRTLHVAPSSRVIETKWQQQQPSPPQPPHLCSCCKVHSPGPPPAASSRPASGERKKKVVTNHSHTGSCDVSLRPSSP